MNFGKMIMAALDQLDKNAAGAWRIEKSAFDVIKSMDLLKSYFEEEEEEEEEEGLLSTKKRNQEREIEVLVEKLRDLAYEVEDMADDWEREVEIRTSSVWKSRFRSIIHRYVPLLAPSPLESISQIATRIEDVNLEIKELLGFDTAVAPSKIVSDRGGSSPLDSVPVALEDDHDVLGIESDMAEMIDHLMFPAGDDNISVVAVVGIGGLGKTTLAKAVFDRIHMEFDPCIWVNASRFSGGFVGKDVLLDILQQFYGGSSVLVTGSGEEEADCKQLGMTVGSCLKGKRLLMVLDDVWDLGGWENIERFLPRTSRIIVTTRLDSLPKRIPGCKYILKPQGLCTRDAWKLFCKKAFPLWTHPTDPEFEMGTHFADLKPIGEEIVRRCSGLPLAIKTIGSLLSVKKTEHRAWEKVLNLFDWHLSSDKKKDIPDAVVSTAYSDLPLWLKPCFLYLGMFPVHYEIPLKRLCRLWMAEGFTQEFSQDRTVAEEKSGRNALRQLLRRNMIEIAKVGTDGEVEACRLLRPMWNFVVRKSSMDNFCTLYSEVDAIPVNLRRLSLAWPRDTAVASNIPASRWEKTRTLVLLAHPNTQQQAPFPSNLLKCRSLLRVLVLDHVRVDNLPADLSCLVHLRYLGMRDTGLKKLPRSLGELFNLQTFDIRGTRILDFPTGFKFLQLRHLLLASSYRDKVVPLPQEIEFSYLVNLETLSGVKITEQVARSLGKLTNLQKLACGQLKKEVSDSLCKSINQMTSLRSLTVKCYPSHLFNLEMLGDVARISKLRLGGPLMKFNRVANISSLTYLYLWDSLLDQDPLQALQNLPNLVHLSMYNAFNGDTMGCDPGGFPQLMKLSVVRFRHLKEWGRIEGGAMQRLRELYIGHCANLRKLPEGLDDLDSLRALKLVNLPIVPEEKHPEEKHRFKVIDIPQFLTPP